MSGGGNSGGGGGGFVASTPAPTEDYARAPTAMVMQPAIPGHIGLLGQQLAEGFGGMAPNGEQDVTAFLDQLYQPMTAYQFQEPISTTAEKFKKGNFKPISTGNPTLDDLLMGK